ncbi:putative membrane protein [hydrothermal vent metagenome]|uniref:Putative membrane protein n=1 Tax=hydrothermal vent metagenome TaxID=652676 RepID=A0A3B0T927_9ZZZZ
MYFYLIIALQVYCAYHCFVNRNNYYWFFAILFLPAIGSILYLFVNVIQKRDVDKVQANIISAIAPTKKITDLEKKVKFAATFQNQVNLADAYLETEYYEKAIENYEASLKDVFQNDFYTISKLEEAYYFSSQFDKAIACAEKISADQKFTKSKAAFLYALAIEKKGNVTAAEEYLKTFDAPYSRYQERLELAKFYIRNDKHDQACVLLQEIVTESEGMSKQSYRQNRMLLGKAKELLEKEA